MSGDLPISVGERPLKPEIPPRPPYSQRITRAESLLARSPASSQILRYYVAVASGQQRVYEALSGSATQSGQQEQWPLRTEILLPLWPGFARDILHAAPAPVRELLSSLDDAAGSLLTCFWSGDLAADDITRHSVALAFLQPYAEWLAQNEAATSEGWERATCPICSSEPVCAVLREKDHGSSRTLICSLCTHEWGFPRGTCPSCGENRFEQLPVFTPKDDAHVRVEACDTCQHYLKCVDMTKDGHAVPIVDELAAVSLDLWASERQYVKLALNLAAL